MSVCMRYRDNESEAAAALNDGFLKILNNIGKYDPKVPFEAWIKRIMINTLIDDFRKNRKVKVYSCHFITAPSFFPITSFTAKGVPAGM